jgi:hypothetical protein
VNQSFFELQNELFWGIRPRFVAWSTTGCAMAKSQNSKKQTKKAPLKTAAEKKAAKRDKKNTR